VTSIEPARYAEGRAMLVAGLRRHHTFADAPRTIAAQWEAFHALGPVPGRRGAVAYGVMCGTQLAEQRFEYMAGVEVESFDALPADLGRMRVPVQHYAVFEHCGHVSTLWQTWGDIWQDWVPRSGRTPADTPDFELYGADFDPATGLGTMEIWFPLQPA
jgi:AraC family transcriptional regulator